MDDLLRTLALIGIGILVLCGWATRMTERHPILLTAGGGLCILLGFALWQLFEFYQNLPAGVAVYTSQDCPKSLARSLLVGGTFVSAALSITGIFLYGLGHNTTWTRRLGLSTLAVTAILLFVLVILAYACAPQFVQSEHVN